MNVTWVDEGSFEYLHWEVLMQAVAESLHLSVVIPQELLRAEKKAKVDFKKFSIRFKQS